MKLMDPAATGLTDAARAELLELLRPWLRVLRERTFLAGAYDIDRLVPNDVIWLRLPATWEVDFRVFEAFELLALAGGVDYQLWRLALSNVATGRAFRAGGKSAEGIPSRIGCVLSFSGMDEFPNAILAWSGRVVSGADPDTASQEYVHVRDWLETVYGETYENTTTSRESEPMVPVRIWLHEGSFEERMEQLAQVADVQFRRHNSEAVRTQWRSLFQVMEMDPGTPDIVTADAFQSMTEIASRGILVERLKPNGVNVTEATALTFARGLPKLFGSTFESASDSNYSAVSIVELPVFMPSRTVAVLMSALRTSRSVQTLAINCALSPWQPDPDDSPRMSRRDRDHLWQWIAFAIFGPHAAHCVDEVRIDADDLTIEDVRAARDQLASSDSIPIDSPGEDTTFGEVCGCAVVSTFHSTRPMLRDDDAPQSIQLQVPPQEALVIERSDDEWCRVLVPGYGLAWVNSQEIDTRSDGVYGHTTGPGHLIIENMHLQSTFPVVELLRVVGAGLTNLSFFEVAGWSVLDDWLPGVFDACPQLQAVIVHGVLAIRSMDTLTGLLARGLSQIERLRLDHLRVIDLHSLESFFHALAHVKNDSMRRLRDIKLSVDSIDVSGSEIVDAVATALHGNHTLHQLDLKLSFQPHARIQPELWHAVKQLHTHNLEPVCIRRGPLPLDKKLGFLSVLAFAGSGEAADEQAVVVRHLVRAMDRPLIVLVFEFAAECERRSVLVRLAKDEE